jgi:hypothetical protein
MKREGKEKERERERERERGGGEEGREGEETIGVQYFSARCVAARL